SEKERRSSSSREQSAQTATCAPRTRSSSRDSSPSTSASIDGRISSHFMGPSGLLRLAQLLQPLARLEEAGAHRADRALHHAGDLRVLQALDVEEDERRPQVLGKLLH